LSQDGIVFTALRITGRKKTVHQDLEKAKNILRQELYTCVLCRGDAVYTSTFRGVKPLVQWLRSEMDFSGFCAADKVIGRATAFLYLLLGIPQVYAQVISRPALGVFQVHGIHVEYGQLVYNIINRRGDGLCPFEAAVLEIQDPQQAYASILHKMDEMNIPY